MSDSINTINIGGIDKEVEDTTARNGATSAAARLTTVESNIQNLSARVDELSTLPEGSTTGDAELVDIRVGEDDIIYQNAGTAVRTQVANAKEYTKNTYDSSMGAFQNLLGKNEYKIYDSYDSRHNDRSGLGGPFIPNQVLSDVFITKIRLNVHTIGKISFGYYMKESIAVNDPYDDELYKVICTVEVGELGEQLIVFDNPLYIPQGCRFAICKNKYDTLRFYFGKDVDFTTKDYGFILPDGATRSHFADNTYNLGIDIYGFKNIDDQFLPLALMNADPRYKEVKLYDGFNVLNTLPSTEGHTASYSPIPSLENSIVTGITINIHTIGTLTIGVYNGEIEDGGVFDPYLRDRKLILEFTETGPQTVMFDTPIYVPKGGNIYVVEKSDTSRFYYGDSDGEVNYDGTHKTELAFLGGRIASKVYAITKRSLGITFHGIIAAPRIDSAEKRKKLSIFGDSISTYIGYIPEGNAVYYNGTRAGVTSVEDTWWMKTINALGYKLLVNNSWSGRAVSSVRDGSSAHATDAGYKEANVLQLKDGDILPDVIIIALGANDFNSECPIGDYDGSTAIPTDPSTFTNAYAMMLDLIMTNFPLAKVYCCTIMVRESNGATGFPELNGNGVPVYKFNEAIRTLAKAFGAGVIDHESCGITYYNMSTYMGDFIESAGTALHPNPAGHSLMANKTIETIDNAIRTRY